MIWREPTCRCGCGGTPKPGNRYLLGHNSQAAHADYAEDANGCWIWQRSYWKRTRRPRKKVAGRWVAAHRWYYEQHVGPIPDGLTLDHVCEVPACVNPAHLEPVSLRENQQRADLIKLNPAVVRAIRQSSELLRVLGERYRVDPSTIWYVRHSRTWAHIPAETAADAQPTPRRNEDLQA
jgi:hypothetical protein